MTIARRLAEFLIDTSVADLPAQTIDHAAMVIASTLASGACGKDIGSAAIVRVLAHERGGREDASVWFDRGPKLPIADAAQVNAVMSDAAASDDSDHEEKSMVRTIFSSSASRVGDRLIYQVRGSGFLKHMVRNIVGVLLEAGKGNLSEGDVRALLAPEHRPPVRAATAPSKGLFLVGVEYSG